MTTDFSNPDAILGTVCDLLEAEGMASATSVLKAADARFERTGYDNWNGGTDIYTLFLQVDPQMFTRLGSKREALEQQISDRIKAVIDAFSDDWVTAQICPRIRGGKSWRASRSSLTQITRREISDFFTVSGTPWSGDLDDVAFLTRLYDLESMPSGDGRFKTASGDIWQHRFNNDDWPADWIFTDERFGIKESDEKFLRFLAETVHPVVRRDRDQVAMLVKELNKHLRPDGWVLAETESISGRPCYAAQRIQSGAVRAVSRARAAADTLDASWMHGEIQRLEKAAESDPSLVVGTAKDLVETCCKTILNRRKVEVPKGTDLPKLVKLLATELKLLPDNISEAAKGAETIRGILRNLATLTQGLAELRGLYGTGHGRDGKFRGLGPRHARLAVASAVAFIDFVTETYHEREN